MTSELPGLIPDIAAPDTALATRIQSLLDSKTKPTGSLGRLEALAVQIGQALGSEAPRLAQPQMLVCAADHGIAAQGVSPFPVDVTWQMVRNFLAGGAAISVLARQHGVALTVADCGVRQPFEDAPGLRQMRIAAGTADSTQGPAMSLAQCEQAIRSGRALVQSLPGNAVLLGEMGIGNTSAASLLLARLTGRESDAALAACVGRGSGLDDAGLQRKCETLARALAANAGARTPLAALAALGGFEIATLAGALLQAASERRVIVVDGFITTAAALAACELAPNARPYCVFAHHSQERGHTLMLERLHAQALLDLGLRLGEGTGAMLAWPLLQSACAILNEMATFESAQVSNRA